MKKIAYVLIISTLVVGLAACSPKSTSTPSNPNDAKSPEVTESSEEVFSNFPQLEGMVLQDFSEGEDGEFSDAIYEVKGMKLEDFYDDYKEMLVKDGWVVSSEDKPFSISVEKDDQVSIFIMSESDEGVLIMVLTK